METTPKRTRRHRLRRSYAFIVLMTILSLLVTTGTTGFTEVHAAVPADAASVPPAQQKTDTSTKSAGADIATGTSDNSAKASDDTGTSGKNETTPPSAGSSDADPADPSLPAPAPRERRDPKVEPTNTTPARNTAVARRNPVEPVVTTAP